MKFYQHPVFDIPMPPWWRYQAQMPPGVFLYIVPILIGLLVPQRWIRTYLLATSLLMIWLTFGAGFFGAILGAVLIGWVLCLVARAALRRGPHWARAALFGGWAVANAIYFAMFWLPVDRVLIDATALDVLLLCGPGFLLFRVLGLFTDICHGKQVGSLRPDRFALFLVFAPTFRLGPITDYVAMNDQLDRCKSQVSRANARRGGLMILIGLVMLFVAGETSDKWLQHPYHDHSFFFRPGFFNAVPTLGYWDILWGMYLIAFRLFLGFSGYSKMARGLCLLLGIHVPENFHWPYLAQNLQSFWRRWHISVSSWLRDYIYIPTGGRNRRTFSSFVVFAYCFLWHQPTLNMLIFAVIHTAGLLFLHGWQAWVKRIAEQKTALFQMAQKLRLVETPLAAALGTFVTFHFWCLALLVMFDPKHCGWIAIKRLLIDPFTS